MTSLEEAMVELTKSQAQFMDETRAIFQIQSAQLERLEMQMAKILSKNNK